VIVPYVRRPGTERFKSSDTMRHRQQPSAASHVMALMASLKIEKALVAGFDDSAAQRIEACHLSLGAFR
jgi:hypothetical protein